MRLYKYNIVTTISAIPLFLIPPIYSNRNKTSTRYKVIIIIAFYSQSRQDKNTCKASKIVLLSYTQVIVVQLPLTLDPIPNC